MPHQSSPANVPPNQPPLSTAQGMASQGKIPKAADQAIVQSALKPKQKKDKAGAQLVRLQQATPATVAKPPVQHLYSQPQAGALNSAGPGHGQTAAASPQPDATKAQS
eukprot:3703103-Rhodomonas_salina.1